MTFLLSKLIKKPFSSNTSKKFKRPTTLKEKLHPSAQQKRKILAEKKVVNKKIDSCFWWTFSNGHFSFLNSIIPLIFVVLQRKLQKLHDNSTKLWTKFSCFFPQFLCLLLFCCFCDSLLAGHKKSFMRRKFFFFYDFVKLQLPCEIPGGNVKQ